MRIMTDIRENFKKAYTRMLQQEKFVQAVISLSEDEGLDLDLARQVDERYGCLEIGDPDDMANKYAGDDKWMDNSLSIIENRFAYVIKAVVDYDEGQIINLKERFYGLGQEYMPEYEGLPIRHIYNVIRDLLLDGGRTEELNEVISEEFDEIIWKRTRSSTCKYWAYLDVDFNKYYLPLRQQFIDGLTEKTDVEFKKLDESVCVLARRM
mgnify:FL=1